jgi:hypothetical protein
VSTVISKQIISTFLFLFERPAFLSFIPDYDSKKMNPVKAAAKNWDGGAFHMLTENKWWKPLELCPGMNSYLIETTHYSLISIIILSSTY